MLGHWIQRTSNGAPHKEFNLGGAVAKVVAMFSLLWGGSAVQPFRTPILPGNGGRIYAQAVYSADHGRTVARLKSAPLGLADDAKTGRVFVANASSSAAITMLSATSGHVLASATLTAPYPADPRHSPGPVDAFPGLIAVDEQSNRVFVLTLGPFNTGSAADVGSPMVFMLDGTTGRVLHATTLNVGPASKVYPNRILVDGRANRVFVGYGSINQMSVLDATTGLVLRTLTLGVGLGVRPLGVDNRDGLMLVRTSHNTLVTVDYVR